jgi:iron complex outermembrane receptor protein
VRQSQTVREAFDFQNVSASLGAIYTLAPGVEVKAYAGTAWRAPNVNELFSEGVHHGTASVEIGDPTLVPERALNAIFTLAYAGSRVFHTEMSIYHNTINDFIYLRPDPEPTLTIRGAFPTFRYDQVNARLSGADLVVKLQALRRLTWITKASWLHAQNRSEQEPLIYMPANRMEHTLKWDMEQVTGLPDTYLSLSSRHVLRQNRTPESLRDYAPPPPGYTLLGIDAGARIPLRRKSLMIGCSLSNLLNTAYRDYLNRFRYYADEPGRNITIRFQFQF